MDKCGRNGGIDTPAECEEHAAVADLVADLLDRFVDERLGRPGRCATGDLGQEVAENISPILGVIHLRVELDGNDVPSFHCCDGGIRGSRDHRETFGRRYNVVTVRHPDIDLVRRTLEQGDVTGFTVHGDRSRSILLARPKFHGAAERPSQ